MSNRTVPKKVVLAYSGGLDTSIILKWLQTEFGCEVVTFTADLGQGEELGPARDKAQLLGIKDENIYIEDVREEFVRETTTVCCTHAKSVENESCDENTLRHEIERDDTKRAAENQDFERA